MRDQKKNAFFFYHKEGLLSFAIALKCARKTRKS